jgi:hypothetical protein
MAVETGIQEGTGDREPGFPLPDQVEGRLCGNDGSEAARYFLVMPVETGIQVGTVHREPGFPLPDQVEDRLRGNDIKGIILNLEPGIRRGQRRGLNLKPGT